MHSRRAVPFRFAILGLNRFRVTTPDPAKLDETPLEGLTAFVAEAKKNVRENVILISFSS